MRRRGGPLFYSRLFKTPHFACITRTILVKFHSCWERTARGEATPKICGCGTIDEMFGAALQSMQVLEVLSIDCRLCRNFSTGRHHYLTNLATRKLRQFYYSCRCTMENGFDPATLLSAPWMQSVTTLSWFPSLWTSIPPVTLRELMKKDDFLPNIETLRYFGGALDDELLTSRTIRRLNYTASNPIPPMDRHPNRRLITHLSVSEYCLIRVLAFGQFSGLQHIGILTFSQDRHGNTSEDAVSFGIRILSWNRAELFYSSKSLTVP